MELTSYYKDTKGMWMIHPYVRSMEGTSCRGWGGGTKDATRHNTCSGSSDRASSQHFRLWEKSMMENYLSSTRRCRRFYTLSRQGSYNGKIV